MKSIDDLFLHFLQDVYFAEQQLVKALPKMAKAAHDPALQQAFTAHCTETEGQVERLKQVFDSIGKPAKAIPCAAIKGLIEEAEEVIAETKPGAVRDAGLVACGQAVEHYEMARYGALLAWAMAGGMKEPLTLLQATLDEEKKADRLLNDLALTSINKEAAVAKAA